MWDDDTPQRDTAREEAEGWAGITAGFGTVLLLCGILVGGVGAFCMGTSGIGVLWLLADAPSSSNPSGQQAGAAVLGVLAALFGLPVVALGAVIATPGAGWLFALYWGRWRNKVSNQD